MAYKNEVTGWVDVDLEVAEVAAIRAVIEGAFKRAGGRGQLPKATSLRNALKGRVAFDEGAFKAGNAAPEGSAEDVALAKAWAEAIADGRGALADLAQWPALQKMVATMLQRPSKAPAPRPAMPPAPAGKVGAAHGVTVLRKARRVA